MLAPDDRHLGARRGVLRVDQGLRQDRAHRVDRRALHRHADRTCRALHPVTGVGEDEPRVLAPADDGADVVRVKDEGDLGTQRLVLRLQQGVPAQKVMVEGDHLPVAELVRGHVVVLDVLRVVTAVQRALALDTEQGQVAAVFQQVRVGVDAGHRRGDPAALHARGGVGQGAHLDQAEGLTDLEERLVDVRGVLPVADELEARLAGHAVPQGTHRTPVQGDRAGVEELRLRQRSAEGALDEFGGQRPLELVAEQLRVTAAGPEGAGRIGGESDVVPTLLRVVPHPVLRGRDPAEQIPVLALAGQDAVGHEVTVPGDRHVLLGLPDRELLEVVGAVVGQHPGGVRALDPHVVHVVREVEQCHALVPGGLLLTPAGVLTVHDLGKPWLRVRPPQQLHRGPGPVDAVLEGGGRHVRLLCRAFVPSRYLVLNRFSERRRGPAAKSI